jgi:hypothetical protein
MVILVELTKVIVVPALPLKRTVDALVKPVPVIVTVVPPATGPLTGDIPVTVGAIPVYVNRSAVVTALVIPDEVTRTSTVPPEV